MKRTRERGVMTTRGWIMSGYWVGEFNMYVYFTRKNSRFWLVESRPIRREHGTVPVGQVHKQR
jgi:hypothetical protein